ncbi:MAG: NIPSNAP family protein [Pseudomonadota bacterium]
MSIFLQSTLTCSGDGLAPFLQTMTQIKPVVEAAGWRLDRAFVQRTGRLNVVIDIWEMDDFNAYDTGVDALVAHPRFAEFKRVLDASLLSEEIVFLSKTEYSP